jgi:hypothetical protein
MIPLTVRIAKVGDPPLFPEYPEATEATLVGFGILEKGTGLGRTSVLFIFQDSTGKHHYAQSTARLLVNGMASACRGAAERFGDDLSQS